MSGEARRVTPDELLRMREDVWRKKVEGISLIAEYDVEPRFTEQAMRVLGAKYQKQPTEALRRSVLRRFPAVHAVCMSKVATEHYAHGTFWKGLSDVAGVVNDQTTQREWGEAFISNLAELGLPTFEDEDLRARYVARILMHSGVPTYCLKDYFRLVAERRRVRAGLEPEAFVEWAAARAATGRLTDVDVPVQRFLRRGGEFAIDVTDRVFELLDLVVAGAPVDDVPLPTRFADVARDMHARGLLAAARRRRESGADDGREAVAPHVVLDPYGRGPLLRLPAVDDTSNGTVTWVVGLDEAEQRVTSTSLWPGFHEPAPQVDLPIVRPVRQITASLIGHEDRPYTLSFVDDADPLLAFSEDGRGLRTSLPLPGAPIWLLFPGAPEEIQSEGEARILTHGVLPPGWAGWSLVLVDLEPLNHLVVGPTGRRHAVRTFTAARICLPEPVASTRTRDGEAIFSQLPKVELPRALDGVVWSISLTDADGTVLARADMSADHEVEGLWDHLERPLCGEFVLKVRGPWGRSATRRFTLVEGLDVECSPPWRRMTGSGLVPVTARVSVRRGLVLSEKVVQLAGHQVAGYVDVHDGTERMRLTVEPAHMSVSHVSEWGTPVPSITALALSTEDVLDDPGSLVLDAGAEAEPTLHLASSTGVIQVLRPKGALRGNAYRFDLHEITDTLRRLRNVRLALDSSGALVLATVRPKRLSGVIEMDGDVLVLEECADIDGLTALCYPTRAPWRGAESVPVSRGKADLPEWLRDAGPLLVSLRIDDPWVPEAVPSWPQPGTSRFVDGSGWLREGDPDEVALSAFLAGAAGELLESADPRRVWDTLAVVWSLGLGDRDQEVDLALRKSLVAQPRRAMDELLQSSVGSQAMPSLLIRTGLVWDESLAATATGVGALPWTRRNALVLSLVGGGADDESAEAAVELCGDVFLEIAGGNDPCATAGRFDQSSDLFVKHTEEVKQMFLRQLALVPKGLLHADSRVGAALQLVALRGHDDLQWLVRHVDQLGRDVRAAIESSGFEVGTVAVNARRHPVRRHGWRELPSWSLSMAIAARLAARGSREPRLAVLSGASAWASLAGLAPDLVTIDLILAELLVRAHFPIQRERM